MTDILKKIKTVTQGMTANGFFCLLLYLLAL